MMSLRIAGAQLSQLKSGGRLICTSLIDLVPGLSARMVADVTEARLPTCVVEMAERARALIHAHLADHRFGVSGWALNMRLSPRHLSSLFAPVGTTNVRPILEVLSGRSQDLLADPVDKHRQIVDIALACGFEQQNHLSRLLRPAVGQSPRNFCKNKDFSAGSLADN